MVMQSEGTEHPLPGYKQVTPKEFTEGLKNVEEGRQIPVNLELREPEGIVAFRDDTREVLIPESTNFPTRSGYQVQIVDRSVDTATLGETPLLAKNVDPKKILQVGALGIVAEEQIVDETDNVWVNFNLHSRPPMTMERPLEVRYGPLTLDIHGRHFDDKGNWARPPVVRGGWGMKGIDERADDNELGQEATLEDIETHEIDPMHRVSPYNPPNPSKSEEFDKWREHPSGMYDWIGSSRRYNPEDIETLKKIFGSDEFIKRVSSLKEVELFTENDLSYTPVMPELHPNDTALWQGTFGGRSYRLVTQKTPLIDEGEGIHMVLQIYPESHTPWESPQQTLEALSIGIGVSRLLQKTNALGEMGDGYLDFNANWSMTSDEKRNLIESLLPDKLEEAKKIIQKDTRTHLHIQLEKRGSKWELPPAPGTFLHQQPQKPETVTELQEILGSQLSSWLDTHCKGKLF